MTRLRVLVAVASLAILGACKVDVSVGIDARADGTGEVRVTALLDEEAAEEVGDLADRLRTDDLEAAGWTVDDPERVEGGAVAQTIRHGFDSPAEAEQVMAQLAGPLEGFTIDQQRGFFRTTTSFTGTVDLARGLEAFGDERLTKALGGQPLGVPVDQLEQRLGATLDRIFGLQVAVRLPGAVESNAPTATGNGGVWSPKLGERVELSADAAQWNVRNIVLLAIAVVSTLALVAVLLVRRFS